MSKGSTPRPIPDIEQFNINFDRIFGKKNENSISTKRTVACKTNPSSDEKAGTPVRLAKDSDY